MGARVGIVTPYVRDVPKARAFYSDILGFEVIPEFSGPGFVFLRAGAGCPLALQDVGLLPPGVNARAGGSEIGIMVDDVDAAWQDWRAKSVEVLSEVQDMGAGRSFLARDPEGHYLHAYHLYEQV